MQIVGYNKAHKTKAYFLKVLSACRPVCFQSRPPLRYDVGTHILLLSGDVFILIVVTPIADNKFRKLIAVKVLHTSLLITTVVAFKILPLRSYAPMPGPSHHFKTILELVLWNGLQSCRCITPDVINVIKMPSFLCFLYIGEQKKVTGG